MAAKLKVSAAKVVMVPVGEIEPSPENNVVYGAIDHQDIDQVNLTIDVQTVGVRDPLVISADGYIISGHRRYAAAVRAGLATVPAIRSKLKRYDHTRSEWIKVLIAHNKGQRVKSAAVRIKEAMAEVDPDIAYQQLIEEREQRDREAPPRIDVTGYKVRSDISVRKMPMLKATLAVVKRLRDFWPLTVRLVHYQLLNRPPLRNSKTGQLYENDRKSYQDLCDLMTRARLSGLIPWGAIIDETRPVVGSRYLKDAAEFLDVEMHNFCRGYRRDLLQSQRDHIELIVEKLTVQGVVEPIASQFCLPMTVGRGYCSIMPRYEIAERYRKSGKDRLILLIASDFDPDGEEIAESLVRSIRDDFDIDQVEASKILLRQDQIADWALPPNNLEAKETSSKFNKFVQRYGSTDVYELEAIQPEQMQTVVREAIEATIDLSAFNAELKAEREDATRIQAVKSSVAGLFSDLSGNGGAE